jgi:KAP family P-loop domain
MRIYPPEIEIGDKDGFSSEKDLFGHAALGAGMTNLVTMISDPMVIAFDGAWGTGKTTFLKMWAGELREQDIPVIRFDAFANDYADDAFAVLARELVALVEAAKPVKEKAIENFKEKSVKLGAQLARVAAKVGTKAVVRVATAGALKDSDLKEAIDEAIEETGDLAESYMRSFLSEPQMQKSVVEEFRQALESLPRLISPPAEGKKQKPLVFIIDELDRCKPLFALQLLERIKHFMSVPNVHFVFGVHLEQLKQSVQFAYGANIDATTYLQKFINLTIANSDIAVVGHERRLAKYIKYLNSNLELPNNLETQLTIEFLQRVATKNDFSLRTVERVFTNIVLATVFAKEREFRNSTLIAGLCILKVVRADLFIKAKQGQLKYVDIAGFFGFQQWSQDEKAEEQNLDRDLWEYALADELPDRLKRFGQDYITSHFQERKDMVSFTANSIVDRFRPNE